MEKKKHNKPTTTYPSVEADLNKLFSPEWLRKTAKETGLIKRERKIDPVLMFWVLVLGFGVQLQRTLASLHREYEETGKVHLSRGSFYERFSPELVTVSPCLCDPWDGTAGCNIPSEIQGAPRAVPRSSYPG
jgi:hypothetical protein